MNSKEQAKELIEQFRTTSLEKGGILVLDLWSARQMALKHVQLAINDLQRFSDLKSIVFIHDKEYTIIDLISEQVEIMTELENYKDENENDKFVDLSVRPSRKQ